MMKIFKEMGKLHIQIIILLLTLVSFLLTGDPIIGLLIGFEIVLFVGFEVQSGASKHGWKHEVIDTLIALIFALTIWFGASLILHTPSPLSAVVSCSMLPNLYRGDMVVIQGTEINAPEIMMSKSQLDDFLKADIKIEYQNKTAVLKGSMYSYCNFNRDEICNEFLSNPEDFKEKRSMLSFNYGKCALNSSGTILLQPCVTSVSYNGKTVPTNFSNDIIVYEPLKSDYYSLFGDIIHRAYIKLSDGNRTFYLTKGDNNPIFDIQVYDYNYALGNLPPEHEKVKGKVLLKIPVLGFFKIFLNGLLDTRLIAEPGQCKTQLIY